MNRLDSRADVPEHDQVLQILGCSIEEQALYEWLLGQPPRSLRAVEEEVTDKLWGDRAGALLARLTERGLVALLPGQPTRYQAVAPQELSDALLPAAERRLGQARLHRAQLAAAFQDAHRRHDPSDRFEVVTGRHAIVDSFIQVQRSARQEVRMCDAPPYIQGPPATDPVQPELIRQGIRYRVLYARDGLDFPGRLADFGKGLAMGEQARVSDVSIKLVLSDRPLALLLPERNTVEHALVIHDPMLLDTLSALFELAWAQAVPLQVRDGQAQLADRADGPSSHDLELLPLLAAGLTDPAIAAHLGRNERTVRRHIGDMLRRLGAADRFQAGYQAIQRGWITTEQSGPA